jgi:hypothetical protein
MSIFLIVAGDPSTFDTAPLKSALANRLGVAESQINVLLSPGSVSITAEVTCTDPVQQQSAWSEMNAIAASPAAASAALGVSVESIPAAPVISTEPTTGTGTGTGTAPTAPAMPATPASSSSGSTGIVASIVVLVVVLLLLAAGFCWWNRQTPSGTAAEKTPLQKGASSTTQEAPPPPSPMPKDKTGGDFKQGGGLFGGSI